MTTEIQTAFTVGSLLTTISNPQEVTLRMDLGGEDRLIEIKGHAGTLYEGLPDELLDRAGALIEVEYDFDGQPYLSIEC